jgi:lysophospholipase L1-like esterase
MKRWISSIVAAPLIALVVLAPTSYATTSPNYTSMGDSVAAGAGLNSSPTGSSEDITCDRSSQAYPHLIAAGLGTSVQQLACSGAKVDEGIYDEQERDGTEITPQLDQAFLNGTPDIITMTIGANDARWVQFLRQCRITICGTSFDNARAKVYRADLRIELYWTLYKIEHMSAGDPPTVLLNGYYAPFNDIICEGTERITAAERAWINARTADLNQAIYSVTQWFSNSQFVPIDFTGHELCSDSPWVQGLSDTAPFHPNTSGQSAIAEANLRALGY